MKNILKYRNYHKNHFFLLLLTLIKFLLLAETLGDGFHVDFGNPYLKGF